MGGRTGRSIVDGGPPMRGNGVDVADLDLLFSDVTVVDGTGAPAFEGSVGVAGDRIAWVGRCGAAAPQAMRRVDGTGRVLAPGFIDVHTHDDHLPFVDPAMAATIRQGVTTVVVGNCGVSLWPPRDLDMFAEYLVDYPDFGRGWQGCGDYLDAVAACRPAVNVATLAGHGTLRAQVMGYERRPPDSGELARLRELAAEAVAEGALGLSTGLVYAPGMYADTDEIAAIAAAVAPAGGIYASHIRGEGRLVFAAVREALEIGRRAGVPAHVSHLKLEGRDVWGRTGELLALFEGEDATADQYPYTAWMTDLSSFLPPWAPVDGLAELLASPSDHRRLADTVEHGEAAWQSSLEGTGWECMVLATAAEPSWEGKDLAAIAAELGEPPVETMFRVLLDKPDAMVVGHAMSENDVRAILARPDVMVGSDGMPLPDDERFRLATDHPRSYGTFPRVLGRYARDERLLALDTAVRKMTSLPADRFGLRDRGRIADDAYADLVLFDPATVADGADFAHPFTPPTGVELVVVNGHVAWDGSVCGRAGRALGRGR